MAWELAREAVAALPIPEREAAELGAIHGWGPREVCDTLGLTHERYAALLQSAHEEVHDLLATWLGEDPPAVPASLRTLRAVPVGQLLADLRPEDAPPAADLDVVFRRWRAARRRARFAAVLRRLGRDATPPTRPAIPTTAPLLVADQLVAGYDSDVNILNGCSLELRAGELVGVIGPNGAGKSTLIKAMFGLVATRAGSVILRGEDVTGLPAHELVSRGVGYVPQRANVFPTLTVQENLEVGVYLNPRLWRQQFGFVVELFPLLGERRRQRVGALSGGERKMVALGRALMAAPSVLLLDEPSAGLSPANQEVVFRRVRDTRNAGISVVMVEQNARRCLEICDRAYVLDQGRNAYSGAGTELLGDPKVIELYLGTLARAS